MSKIAQHLQEHIKGEVTTSDQLLAAHAQDASVLTIKPEIVVFPRVTNDIRKVARFTWQLAEKGHVLPITARGAGSDQTGAAIGKGIVIAHSTHMNNILEFDAKQKLIRAQPGVSVEALASALRLHGLAIPALPLHVPSSTIGGAVANNANSPMSGAYGAIDAWVHQIEVVLANGDILQTRRISKRELSQKKGLQTLEGEIYRNLDNLIEDNKQLIADKLSTQPRDKAGYSTLASVKQKDGSFDLSPLIIGSQGTLGIVSELILKAGFMSQQKGALVAAFSQREVARDALDLLRALNPSTLDYFDGELFKIAAAQGKRYDFGIAFKETPAAVIVMTATDFNDAARARKLKKALKLLAPVDCSVKHANGAEAVELLEILDVANYTLYPSGKDESAPSLFDGVYVPRERFEDFQKAVSELAKKQGVSLALHGRVLEDVYYARPTLQLKKVGDKQKIFKLLDQYSTIVDAHHGHITAEAGEGRMLARFAYKYIDEDVRELFEKVKKIFDPLGTLNPEVKQSVELRSLVSYLAPQYDASRQASTWRYK